MRAIMKMDRAPGVKFVDIKKPTPKDDEILFQVKAAAICGTDYSAWKWNKAGEMFSEKYEAQYPFILGHECCGVITELGKNVTGFQIGDRISLETHIYCGDCYQCRHGDKHNCQHLKIYGISCDGCFAEYATVPAKCAFRLPATVSFEQGALFEPAGVAMFALQEADIHPGDVVMIYGCGPIGQMAIQLALACGAGTVIAVDIDDYKAELARNLGAVAVNSMKQDIGEVVKQYCSERGGVDVIMEISGASTIYDTMADYLRKEGKIMLLAHPGDRVSFDIMKTMHHSGATIRGIFGRRIWSSWHALTELVESGKVDLTKVITHRFPLSAGNKAFEQISAGAGKVLFLPEIK